MTNNIMDSAGVVGSTGKVLSVQQVRDSRHRRGQCLTCGRKLFDFRPITRTRIPRTVDGLCREGRCLICNPVALKDVLGNDVDVDVDDGGGGGGRVRRRSRRRRRNGSKKGEEDEGGERMRSVIDFGGVDISGGNGGRGRLNEEEKSPLLDNMMMDNFRQTPFKVESARPFQASPDPPSSSSRRPMSLTIKQEPSPLSPPFLPSTQDSNILNAFPQDQPTDESSSSLNAEDAAQTSSDGRRLTLLPSVRRNKFVGKRHDSFMATTLTPPTNAPKGTVDPTEIFHDTCPGRLEYIPQTVSPSGPSPFSECDLDFEAADNDNNNNKTDSEKNKENDYEFKQQENELSSMLKPIILSSSDPQQRSSTSYVQYMNQLERWLDDPSHKKNRSRLMWSDENKRLMPAIADAMLKFNDDVSVQICSCQVIIKMLEVPRGEDEIQQEIPLNFLVVLAAVKAVVSAMALHCQHSRLQQESCIVLKMLYLHISSKNEEMDINTNFKSITSSFLESLEYVLSSMRSNLNNIHLQVACCQYLQTLFTSLSPSSSSSTSTSSSSNQLTTTISKNLPIKLRHNNGIKTILSTMEHHAIHPKLQATCCSILGNASNSDYGTVCAIDEEKGLIRIFEAMENHVVNDTVIRCAFLALSKLSLEIYEIRTSIMMMVEGGDGDDGQNDRNCDSIAVLLNAMKRHVMDSDVVRCAFQVFTNLAVHNRYRRILFRQINFMSVMTDGMSHHLPVESVQEVGIKMLRALFDDVDDDDQDVDTNGNNMGSSPSESDSTKHIASFVTREVIAVILRIMRRYDQNLEIQIGSTTLLWTFSLNNIENKRLIKECDGIGPIINSASTATTSISLVVDSPTTTTTTASGPEGTASKPLLEACYKALWSLALVEENRYDIARYGGIPVIIKGTKECMTDEVISEAGLGLLKFASLNYDCCERLILDESGGLDVVIFALQVHMENLILVEYAISILSNLVSYLLHQKKDVSSMVSLDVIDAIVQAMSVHKNCDKLQKTCCLALYNFCSNRRIRKSMKNCRRRQCEAIVEVLLVALDRWCGEEDLTSYSNRASTVIKLLTEEEDEEEHNEGDGDGAPWDDILESIIKLPECASPYF